MEKIRIIKSDEEHASAIARLEALMMDDPEPESVAGEELSLLSLIIEEYEGRRWPIDPVSPIEAISFRMEQMGLKQKDLIPYIGSAGKVSEVLSGKRSLTTDMIRALHDRLAIPLKSLVMEQPAPYGTEGIDDPDRYPLKEMVRRKWITLPPRASREKKEEILGSFLFGVQRQGVGFHPRRTKHIRSGKASNPYALEAWTAAAIQKAQGVEVDHTYPWKTLGAPFLREIARLSGQPDGISRVADVLGHYGIRFTVLQHLPQTYLDGAAIFPENDNPVVCLTLRHDRVDNFWFTLLHELAHVVLHHEDSSVIFYDNLDVDQNIDSREQEADEAAGEALVPTDAWNRSPAKSFHSEEAVKLLAHKVGVAPEVVAGKIRRMTGKYSLLTGMVGKGDVRNWFDLDLNVNLES